MAPATQRCTDLAAGVRLHGARLQLSEPGMRKYLCGLKPALPGVLRMPPRAGSGAVSIPQVFLGVVGQERVSMERGPQLLVPPAPSCLEPRWDGRQEAGLWKTGS